MTSVTPIERTASATLCPCDTSTSTWRSFATISSGLCLFLGIVVLLGSKAIPQGGPLQRGGSVIGYDLAVGKLELTFDEWDACLADDRFTPPDDEGWER